MSKQVVPQRMIWLVGGGAVLMILLLSSAFYRGWETNRALRNEKATLEPMLTAALVEQQTLQAQLAYAKSDEYVEWWAQTHARMARPGETLVVLLEDTPTPAPIPVVPTPTPTPESVPFWSRWWRALGGD